MTSPIHLQPEDFGAALGTVWLFAGLALVVVAGALTEAPPR
jgi:hypothetical protein